MRNFDTHDISHLMGGPLHGGEICKACGLEGDELSRNPCSPKSPAMTPPLHTLSSLLALSTSPSGLEQLRILAAEADGYTKVDATWCWIPPEGIGDLPYMVKTPDYPASLDAIFAAEARFGIHDRSKHDLVGAWTGYAKMLLHLIYGHATFGVDLAFLTPVQRTILFILTAQELNQQNKTTV